MLGGLPARTTAAEVDGTQVELAAVWGIPAAVDHLQREITSCRRFCKLGPDHDLLAGTQRREGQHRLDFPGKCLTAGHGAAVQGDSQVVGQALCDRENQVDDPVAGGCDLRLVPGKDQGLADDELLVVVLGKLDIALSLPVQLAGKAVVRQQADDRQVADDRSRLARGPQPVVFEVLLGKPDIGLLRWSQKGAAGAFDVKTIA